MMLHLEGVLSKTQVETLRKRLLEADWLDGRTTVGAQGARVKRNRQIAEHAPAARGWQELILDALHRHATFFSAALPARIVPPLFNLYEGGEHYGDHVDGAVRPLQGSQQGYLRTDLSCTLFLTEPDAYDGGELVVADTYGEHEAKLPAGDLLLYPSTSLHRVAPVTRGARLCSFFWVQSMVRSVEHRHHLYELDQAIGSLRARHGDEAEVVTLTALYHNLLRAWVEV